MTDCLSTSLHLSVSPEDAFRLFTEQTDQWWKHGAKFRFMQEGAIRFEPGVGGRLVQVTDGGRAYEVGRILAWVPGRLLSFEWRLDNFEAGQLTRVEIIFAPEGDGTRLSLEHRGWDTLPQDHPARHRLTGFEFVTFRTQWWDELLAGFSSFAESAD